MESPAGNNSGYDPLGGDRSYRAQARADLELDPGNPKVARAGLTDVFRSRDHWLEPWEKVAIVSLHHQFPLEGYRRRVGPGGWWR